MVDGYALVIVENYELLQVLDLKDKTVDALENHIAIHFIPDPKIQGEDIIVYVRLNLARESHLNVFRISVVTDLSRRHHKTDFSD